LFWLSILHDDIEKRHPQYFTENAPNVG